MGNELDNFDLVNKTMDILDPVKAADDHYDRQEQAREAYNQKVEVNFELYMESNQDVLQALADLRPEMSKDEEDLFVTAVQLKDNWTVGRLIIELVEKYVMTTAKENAE